MLPSIRIIFLPEYRLLLLAGCFITIFVSGCNTRIQGCLEVNAENFNLDAERPCDDCCTYPSMGLTLTQKWGDENFANADTLYDINDLPYQITDLRYFLTSWSWSDLSGEMYTVDSVEAPCDSGVLTYAPDVLVIDTRKFAYTLGTIRQASSIVSVEFDLGLVEDFSCLDADDPDTPPDLTEQSPLWNPQTSRLETMRLVVRKSLDSEAVDTIFINTQMNGLVPYSEEMEIGSDFSLKLTVNYAQWFQEADRNNLSSFSQSILSHYHGSIYQTP